MRFWEFRFLLPEFRFLLPMFRLPRHGFRRLRWEFTFPLADAREGFRVARRVVQRVRLPGTMFRELRQVFREHKTLF